MEKRQTRSQFIREHEANLSQIAKDKKKHNEIINELEAQKQETEKQIVLLENEMKKYSKKIGLDKLRKEYAKLEKTQKTIPVQTCCKHITYYHHSFRCVDDDGITTYECHDCGMLFDSDSDIYKNLRRLKIYSKIF